MVWESLTDAAILTLVLGGAAALVLVRTYRRGDDRLRTLALVGTAATVAAMVTLALTAIWLHHLQVLAFPLALMVAFLVAAGAHLGAARMILVTAGVFALLVAPSARDALDGPTPVQGWFRLVNSITADFMEEARASHFASAERVTYMHFGQNGENAHAVFVGDGFDLACPRFHQYPHTTRPLFDALSCVKERKPMLLLVTPGLRTSTTYPSEWNAFVRDAEDLLEAHYVLASGDRYFRVFARRPA